MAFCTNCGSELATLSEYCRQCGCRLTKSDPRSSSGSGSEERRPVDPETNLSEPPAADSHAPAIASDRADETGANALGSLSRSDAIQLTARSIGYALIRSIAIAVIVLGPGFLLLFSGQLVAGMIVLFLGSFGLVAYSYRKPWRLNALSCLIPPITAVACYSVQLWLFGDASPPGILLLAALAGGALIGVVRGRAHVVYEDNGGIFAQRTLAYLVIWIAAYVTTQLLGMTAANVWAVRGGLVTGAFTTAMLAVVSIMLYRQRDSIVRAALGCLILALGLLPLDISGRYFARAQSDALVGARETLLDSVSRAEAEFNNWLIANGSNPLDLSSRRMTGVYDRATADYVNGAVQVVIELFPTAADAEPQPGPGQSVEFDGSDRYVRGVANDGSWSIIRTSKGRYRIEAESRLRDIDSFEIMNLVIATGLARGYRIAIRPDLVAESADQPVTAPQQSGDGARQSEDRCDVLSAACLELPSADSPQACLMASCFRRAAHGDGVDVPSCSSARRAELLQMAAQLDEECRAIEAEALRQRSLSSESENTAQPAEGLSAAVPDDRESYWFPPGTDRTAAAIAITTAILIAAGIAANLAQMIAAAVANALQAGVDLTSQDVSKAIFSGAFTKSEAVANEDGVPNRAPPKPPPIVNPHDGTAFETNAQGDYWAPDSNGDWRWMGAEEAHQAAAEIGVEAAARQDEIDRHNRQAQDDLARSRQIMRDRDDSLRREELAERQRSQKWHEEGAGSLRSHKSWLREEEERQAREDAVIRDAEAGISPEERRRIGQLASGVENAIRSSALKNEYSELMDELERLRLADDRAGLERLWAQLRGERLNFQNELLKDAQMLKAQSDEAQLNESAVTWIRDKSKVGLMAGIGIATGGTASLAQAAGSVAIGTGALTTTGAVEHGYKVIDGEVQFDAWEAKKGAARGLLDGVGSAVGGVSSNGSKVVSAGKAMFKGTSTYGRTFADTFEQTGNRELAHSRAGMAATADTATELAGEYFAQKSNQTDAKIEALKGREPTEWGKLGNAEKWDDVAEGMFANEKLRIAAGKTATNLLGGTLTNIASSGTDLTTGQAFGQAAQSELDGYIAGKIIGTANANPQESSMPQPAIAADAEAPGSTHQKPDTTIEVVQPSSTALTTDGAVERSASAIPADLADTEAAAHRRKFDSADPEQMDPVVRKARNWLQERGDFPSARGDEIETPELLGLRDHASAPTASGEQDRVSSSALGDDAISGDPHAAASGDGRESASSDEIYTRPTGKIIPDHPEPPPGSNAQEAPLEGSATRGERDDHGLSSQDPADGEHGGPDEIYTRPTGKMAQEDVAAAASPQAEEATPRDTRIAEREADRSASLVASAAPDGEADSAATRTENESDRPPNESQGHQLAGHEHELLAGAIDAKDRSIEGGYYGRVREAIEAQKLADRARLDAHANPRDPKLLEVAQAAADKAGALQASVLLGSEAYENDYFGTVMESVGADMRARQALDDAEANPDSAELLTRAQIVVEEAKVRQAALQRATKDYDSVLAAKIESDQDAEENRSTPFEHRPDERDARRTAGRILAESENDQQALAQRLEQVQRNVRAMPASGAALQREYPHVQDLNAHRQRLQALRAQNSDVLGANDPSVQAIEQRISALDRRIQDIQDVEEDFTRLGHSPDVTLPPLNDRVNDIIKANNARLAEIEEQQARRGPYQDLSGDTDVLADEAARLRATNSRLSNKVIGAQVNKDAPSGAPPGLNNRQAEFSIHGADTPLPRTAQELSDLVRMHVEQKRNDTPYQSWTTSREIAEQRYGGRTVAVADMPIEDYRRMVENDEIVPPGKVRQIVAERYHSDQELLVTDVESWRVDDSDRDSAPDLTLDPSFRDVLSYVGDDGRRYVRFYRSMSPNDLVDVRVKPDILKHRR